jgi:AraC family transcriptional regulator of adaptative response / DNA-3-methyladenine glycosylase II
MTLDPDACYRAVTARDARFDGLFFVCVKTTGIYCRPVCRARTPGRDRCLFVRTAAEAEHAGFRACFRCRPELAPGAAPLDAVPRLVAATVARIDAGGLADGNLADLARELGVSDRHLRRAVRAELGVSPVELAQSRRLALARQLLAETALPVTEVAFAAGFRSLRRFNAVFRARCGRAPSQVRSHVRRGHASDTLTLTLSYRPPYDWEAMLGYLAARAVPGVEQVDRAAAVYRRTVRMGAHRGWLAVAPASGGGSGHGHALRAEISLSLCRALVPLTARLRRLFDLDAHPGAIAAHLGADPRLAAHVEARPGLRVPGAFDGFEAAVRAIVGQQVSVAAATTLAGRLASALGEPARTPHAALARFSARPADVAVASEQELAALGLPLRRARTLRAVAQAVRARELSFEPGAEPERLIEQLIAMAGIGPWTAHTLAMRALGWPDAFPESDLGLLKALGVASGRQARALAEPWRPWRAYGATHLWTAGGAAP